MPNEVKLLPCPFCGVNPRDGMNGRTCYHPKNDCTLDGWHFNVPNWQSRPTTVVTDEVVERVAAAMRKQPALSPATKGYPSGDMVDFIMLARAAIASMPTVVIGEQPQDLGDHALPCSASSPVARSRPKAAAAIARKDRA